MIRYLLTSFLFIFVVFESFSQTLYPKKDGKRWGLVNDEDSLVISAKYTAIGDYSSDYTWVNIGGKSKFDRYSEGGKWGVLDSLGNEICPVIYDYVDLCNGHIVAINIGGKIKKEIVSPKYDQVGPFSSYNVAWVYNGTSSAHRIISRDTKNKKGKVIDKIRLFNVEDSFDHTLILDNKPGNGKWCLINSNGEELTNFDFDTVFPFKMNVAYAKKNSKFAIISTDGKLLTDFIFEKIISTNIDGYSWAKKNGKYALIRNNGENITDFKYVKVKPFESRVAWVSDNQLFCLLDLEGKELTPMKYEQVSEFSYGIATNITNKSYVLVNTSGKEIVRAIYALAPGQFGVCQFKPSPQSKIRVVSWITHPQLGTSWFTNTGEVLLKNAKATYKINDLIPDALWDY